MRRVNPCLADIWKFKCCVLSGFPSLIVALEVGERRKGENCRAMMSESAELGEWKENVRKRGQKRKRPHWGDVLPSLSLSRSLVVTEEEIYVWLGGKDMAKKTSAKGEIHACADSCRDLEKIDGWVD